MKKLFYSIILIVCALSVCACAKQNTDSTIYATALSFSSTLKDEGVELYVGDTCVFESSDIAIQPSGYSLGYELVAQNSEIIQVSDNSITALSVGTTLLYAKAKGANNQPITDAIQVVVAETPVEHIYATDVHIVQADDSFTLFVGANGTFDISINPAGYTEGLTITSSSNCLEVDNLGHYTALSAGSTTLTISYYTAEGEESSATYNVTILDKHTQLNLLSTGSNHFVGVMYTLTLSSNVPFVTSDISKILLSGATFGIPSISDGNIVVSFSFTESGNKTIYAQYNTISFDDSVNLNQELDICAYDYVTELIVSSYPVDIDDNTLTLNMCNVSSHVNSTELIITPNHSEPNALGYELIIANDSIVSYSDGVLTALSSGTTTLSVHMLDEFLDDYVLTIIVLPCYAESIDVQVETNLFVGGVAIGYPSSSSVNVTMYPTCSVDVPNITTSSEFLTYSNGVITATKSGEYTITITTENCEEIISIHVYDLPTEVVLTYSGNALANNQIVQNLVGTLYNVVFTFRYGGEDCTYVFVPTISCNNDNVIIEITKNNEFCVYCGSETSAIITFSLGNVTMHFTIEFVSSV